MPATAPVAASNAMTSISARRSAQGQGRRSLAPRPCGTAALATQVATIFKGTTLRGMLLNAYGWWQMGQIMLVSAFVAFGAAALFLILSLFGFWHISRTTAQAEVFPKLATKVTASA